jgi:hypothetical protein
MLAQPLLGFFDNNLWPDIDPGFSFLNFKFDYDGGGMCQKKSSNRGR